GPVRQRGHGAALQHRRVLREGRGPRLRKDPPAPQPLSGLAAVGAHARAPPARRLGLYPESAGVAREILAAGERGQPGYAGVVAAMARISLGQSLLLDLRLAEARSALLPVKDGVPEAAWVGPTARLLLGRCLELEGDRDAALVHYRRAAEGADKSLKRRAQQALAAPIPAREVRGT